MSDDLHAAFGSASHDEIRTIIKDAVNAAIEEAFERIGIDASDQAARAEVRKDMEAIRKFRAMWDNAAKKIGNAVLALMLVGAAALAALGVSIQAKGMK